MKFLTLICSLMVGMLAFGQTAVKSVKTQFEGDFFYTDIEFTDSISHDSLSVDFINETIQVNVPNATIANGKKLTAVRKNNIRSVYTYQYQPGLLRVRIIYDQIPAIKFKDHVKLQSSQRHLRIVTAIWPKPKNVARAKPMSRPQAVGKGTVDVLSDDEIISRELAFANKAMKAETAPAKAAAPMDDDAQPLNLQSKEPARAESQSTQNILYSLLALGILAAMGLIYLKFFQNSGKLANKHTSIKVLTQHYLGPKKSLAIVQVAGESILIGVTDHNINAIKTLSLLDEEVPQIESAKGFDETVEEVSQLPEPEPVPKALYGRNAMPQTFDEEETEEDFAMSDIKDLVKGRLSQLKDFRA